VLTVFDNGSIKRINCVYANILCQVRGTSGSVSVC